MMNVLPEYKNNNVREYLTELGIHVVRWLFMMILREFK